MATGKKILKLDTLMIEDNFFEHVALIGLSTDKAIYTLCHLINEAFALQFERKPKLDVSIGKKNEAFTFAVYQSPVPQTDHCFTLYKLRVGDVHLLPSVRNIDYIWMISDEDPTFKALQYIKALRALPQIQFATLLEKEKIKNIDYLIL